MVTLGRRGVKRLEGKRLAGLLGQVAEVGPFKFRATWTDRDGMEWSAEFTTKREAVDCVPQRTSTIRCAGSSVDLLTIR
ncbi:hypothetical protein [Micromonospora sp. NPDC023633]|uniref:hypothetical protein n=1 Tax=Micromonospora sp. NPDC023633 TaxID=3154320 RepID=UPI0033F56D15